MTEQTSADRITRLYDSHWNAIVRLVWLLVRDQSVSEDIAQDAFVATYRAGSRLRDDDAALAWLHRCAINGVRSRQRHLTVVRREQAAEVQRADALGRLAHSSAADEAMGRLANQEMLAAMNQLPQRQREVLVLRYYADLSEAQIAAALDISTGSVKTHASRGLQALRQQMEVPGE